MRMRLGAAFVAVCALVACAPTPGGEPSATQSPDATDAQPSAEPSGVPESSEGPEPSELEESPTPTPAGQRSPSPTSTAPAPKKPAPPVADGWTVLDTKLTSADQVDGLAVTPEVAHYLKSRMGEPCDLQMTLFASHSDGFVVGDETGICDGSALFVYGPRGDEIDALVEFTQVPECSAFEKAGVPKGVPTSKLFPDGLACSSGGKATKY